MERKKKHITAHVFVCVKKDLLPSPLTSAPGRLQICKHRSEPCALFLLYHNNLTCLITKVNMHFLYYSATLVLLVGCAPLFCPFNAACGCCFAVSPVRHLSVIVSQVPFAFPGFFPWLCSSWSLWVDPLRPVCSSGPHPCPLLNNCGTLWPLCCCWAGSLCMRSSIWCQ